MRNARIYIDQNIVGHFRDRSVDFSKLPDVTWIYSNEHYWEINRADELSFLDVFKRLKAQEIEIALDEKFRITDNAYVRPYSCPYERYELHTKAVSEPEINENLFCSPFARLHGADNYPSVLSLPTELKSHIRGILEPIGLWDEGNARSVEQVSADLDIFVRSELSEKRSLESLRKLLGTDKGKIGNPKTGDPIAEIWAEIGAKFNGLTADQFFGFDPLDKQGYEKWPMYLGIIRCYSILNFLGFRTDKKIASEAAAPSIMSDASHVAYGAFCDVLMSEDARLCSKARAIYKFKNIPTHVVEMKAARSQNTGCREGI